MVNSPLMLRVLSEFGACKITEAPISEKGWLVEGVCDGRYICINPAPSICNTVIHELLHKLHPAWTEAYVQNRARYLTDRMTAEEQWAFYTEYLKRRRRRKTVLKVETE